MPTIPTPLAAALADRYRIDRELGAGGMATVYLAEDLKHDRQVAVKVLRPELAAALGPERFLREIRTTANLRHPHILPLYDSGDAAGFLYYVMPFVDGESLADRLARDRQLPVDEAIRIAGQVADALSYAHQQQVVHRDIKPANIMLERGHAVVADFGIARALGEAGPGRLTQTGMAVGTPPYMSPEQAAGEATVDSRTDIYSLGCVLFEMLAGQPPFTGPTAESVVRQHLLAAPSPVTQFRPAVPAGLAATIDRALQKSPADRFADARALASALSSEQPTATPPKPTTGSPGRSVPWRLVAGAAAVFVVALFAWRTWAASKARPGDIDPAAVAILPFEIRGGGDVSYLREGMVDLLSTKLDGLGGLRALDPRRVLTAVGSDETTYSPREARALATRLGAARAITGSVTLAGGLLQISSSAYDVPTGARRAASVEGSVDSLFALVDRLVTALVAEGIIGGQVEAVGLEALTTESNEALRLYLDGVSAFRGGRGQDESYHRLARAAALDSTFALASMWAGIAAVWFELLPEVTTHLRQADRHRDRLGARDGLRLSAVLASADGRHADAIPLFASLVERYPEDVAGWFGYAEELAHSGPYVGLSLADARPAYERVLELDPGMTPAAFHLANLGGVLADTTALLRWAVTLDSLAAEPAWPALMRLMLGVVRGDSAMVRMSFSRYRALEGTLPAATMAASTGILAGGLGGRNTRLARWFLEEFRVRALTDTARAVATRRLYQFEVGAGRFLRARELLEQGGATVATVLPHDLAFLALHPAHPDPAVAAREARTRLATTAPPSGSGEAAARHFLLARLDLRTGDLARSGPEQAALRAFQPANERVGRFARDLAFELDAIRLGMVGDPDGALGSLLHASYWQQKEEWLGLPAGGYFFDLLYVRPIFLRAQLLRQAGRDGEAVRWFRVATDVPWYRGPALRALAEILGVTEEAEDLRRQLTETFSEADPGVRGPG